MIKEIQKLTVAPIPLKSTLPTYKEDEVIMLFKSPGSRAIGLVSFSPKSCVKLNSNNIEAKTKCVLPAGLPFGKSKLRHYGPGQAT